MITYHSAVLFVKDIGTSKDFYTQVLEQVVRDDFGASVGFESGLSLWQIQEGHEIAPLYQKDKSSGFELCFETTDFAAAYSRILEHGVKLLHAEKIERWGQKTVRFFDPDGHLLEVGETLETFCRRLHAEGESIEEVAGHTGIPLAQVRGWLA